MAASIPLTQGLTALVDQSDLHLVEAFKWHAAKSTHGEYYAISGNRLVMHKVIMGVSGPQIVDHINGNGLDNRRCNLRLASKAENNRNARRKPPQAGYRGVSVNRSKFQARIMVDRRHVRLGRFADPLEAALAYDQAAREFHGEFAVLNFPADPA